MELAHPSTEPMASRSPTTPAHPRWWFLWTTPGRILTIGVVLSALVVACAFALGATPGVALLAAVALPLVLLATEAFYRVVEHPSHELSRRIGHLTRARVAPSDA